MPHTPSCDVCETPLDRTALPPNLQQLLIKLAVEEYDVLLCVPCINTKTLPEIIAAAQGRPGGTAEGAESLAYLVRG